MRFLSVRAHRGPNIWSCHPVLEAWVDLEVLRDSPSSVLPGFNDRLMTWLPSLIEHRCSVGVRGGFHQRLRWGTYLAHILEHVTLELQSLSGTVVGYGRARETTREGVYKVAIRYHEEELGRACLSAAHRLLLAAVYDHPFDMAVTLKELKEVADRVCLGPSTAAIVTAAAARKIPTQRLNAGSLVQLGYGCKLRRIWTAETDRTSAIAESIASDKDLTKAFLKGAGVPVPEGRPVIDRDDACVAADEIEGSVVVKPIDGNHGRGVFMDLRDPELIRAAHDVAAKEGSGVIVEQYIPGHEHRLLIVGGKLVAAARGVAASVTGDGVHTIAQLIDLQVNADPRRGTDQSCPLNPVLMDALTVTELQNQGRRPEEVLRTGERVLVRRNDNLSEDVTDIVHPSVTEHAVVAARVVGLDIAGIDLVVNDVSLPLEDQGGAIVEVNAGPGLLPHLRPAQGQPRPVGEAIVEWMFPHGETGRIPIVAVTGTNGKTTTTRLVTQILAAAGYHVGMACTDGILVDGRIIDRGDCAGPRSARKVLMNPAVDAAVFECARGGILREGLGFDRCDVAIVTNIGEGDHLGDYDLHTPEDMYKVKRCVVDVVTPSGTAVLNAADPLVLKMAELSDGGVILFARDATLPAIVDHCRQGHRAVVIRDGWICRAEGTDLKPLMELAAVPCTHQGRVPFQVDNVLAAVAAAWHLQVPDKALLKTLQDFQGNLVDNPARFNVIELSGKTLIVFDGRNTSALQALGEAMDRFAIGQRLVVYSAENDRRPADIRAQGEWLGRLFDSVVLCDINLPFGDGSLACPENVVEVLQAGLVNPPRARDIEVAPSWEAAIDRAWLRTPPGGLLVVQSCGIAETVKKMQRLTGLEPGVMSANAAVAS